MNAHAPEGLTQLVVLVVCTALAASSDLRDKTMNTWWCEVPMPASKPSKRPV